uniref:glycosyltransferase n=1 Tax=Agathobacter sp. TaxID=2021311 RepID=UPI00405691DC
MKKIMMLTTTAYMSERFNRGNIEILESMGYEVHVVANFDKGNPTTKEVLDGFRKWVGEHHGKCISIPVTNKPFDLKNNGKAYKTLIELIRKYRYEFIHCHTPVAGVLGRLVAHKTNTKVMYTAHGFHFFKGAPFVNWLLYYPIERFLSRWTDVLITINKEDYQCVKKVFYAKRIIYIPGVGIDLNKFKTGIVNKKEKRNSLNLTEGNIMLLSVGELNVNKNHEAVIRAIASLNNPKLHYFIVGKGLLKEKLEILAQELKISKQIHLLGYREDVVELLQMADIYIFPSKREGLSVALMEAIAARIPVLCSDIRGNNDLVIDIEYRFRAEDIIKIAEKIEMVLLQNNTEIIKKNYQHLKQFEINKVKEKMYMEYFELLLK